LSVIDRTTALGAFKNKHNNDTRYITSKQTSNPRKDGKVKEYVQPEIRIEREFRA